MVIREAANLWIPQPKMCVMKYELVLVLSKDYTEAMI